MALQTCHNCGNKVGKNQKFCSKCGTQINQEQTVSVFGSPNTETHSEEKNHDDVGRKEYYLLPNVNGTEKRNTINKILLSKWYYFLIAGIAVIALLCVVLSKFSTNVTIKNEPKEYGIGDTVQIEDVNITLDRVENFDATFSIVRKPEVGKEYLMLWFTLKNAGNGEFNFNNLGGDNSLCDGEKISSLYGFEPFVNLGSSIWGTIAPGEEKQGYAVYEVDVNWNNFEFIYDPTPFEIGVMNDKFELEEPEDDSVTFNFSVSDVSTSMTQYSSPKYGLTSFEDVKDIYKFTLNGKEYSLPFKASDLFELGWEPGLADPQTDTLDAATYSVYTLYKGVQTIDVSIANVTNEPDILNNCMVMEINVTKDSAVTFETADGFKIGDSCKTVYEKYGDEKYRKLEDIKDNQLQYKFLDDLLSDGRLTNIGSTNNFTDNLTIRWDAYEKITSIRMNLVLFN